MSYHSQFELWFKGFTEIWVKPPGNLWGTICWDSSTLLASCFSDDRIVNWHGTRQARSIQITSVHSNFLLISWKKDKGVNSSLILINFIVTSLWHFKMKSIFLLFTNGKFLKCGISLSSAHLTGHISSVQAAHLVGATTQIKPGGWRLHPTDWGANPGFTLLQKLCQ